VKISDDILVIMSDFARGFSGSSVHYTSGGDWLHIQFRLSGGGREGITEDAMISTPAGSCVTIRIPNGASIIREFESGTRWKVLCIYMRPRAIERFFGINLSGFSHDFRWLPEIGSTPLYSDIVALSANSIRVVSDMFVCPHLGDLRRLYMQAKVLELFVSVAGRYCLAAQVSETIKPALHADDQEKIQSVIRIMNEEVNQQHSLGTLARRVALNRTDLAEKFRRYTGETTQSYWRDLRLTKAHELLEERVSVTEVAARVGYANMSSFTRAFFKRYGILPKRVITQNSSLRTNASRII